MNVEGLTIIAEWLEAGAQRRMGRNRLVVGFDMQNVYTITACGTVCCIAGASSQLLPTMPDDGSAAFVGQANLGLTNKMAAELFTPKGLDAPGGPEYDAPWAARCIRNLIATGVVDWEGTRHG